MAKFAQRYVVANWRSTLLFPCRAHARTAFAACGLAVLAAASDPVLAQTPAPGSGPAAGGAQAPSPGSAPLPSRPRRGTVAEAGQGEEVDVSVTAARLDKARNQISTTVGASNYEIGKEAIEAQPLGN